MLYCVLRFYRVILLYGVFCIGYKLLLLKKKIFVCNILLFNFVKKFLHWIHFNT